MTPFDCRPSTMSSSGAINIEQFGSTLARTLYEPIKDLMRPTVSGAGQEARVEMRCALATSPPDPSKNCGRSRVNYSLGCCQA